MTSHDCYVCDSKKYPCSDCSYDSIIIVTDRCGRDRYWMIRIFNTNKKDPK